MSQNRIHFVVSKVKLTQIKNAVVDGYATTRSEFLRTAIDKRLEEIQKSKKENASLSETVNSGNWAF